MIRLLVVDDEPLVQVGLESMLDWDDMGIEFIGAVSNGQQALELIKSDSPDIVITDVKMPVMSGIELIEKCRHDMDETPQFIVLSSHEDFSYLRKAIRLDAVDYLVKLELTPEILAKSIEVARSRISRRRLGTPSQSTANDGAVLKDAFFIKLLNRVYATEQEVLNQKKKAGVHLEGDYFTAALCHVQFKNNNRLNEEERGRLLINTMQMVGKIAGRDLPHYALPVESTRFVAIFGLDHKHRDPRTELKIARDLLNRALEMAEKYFALSLSAGMGEAMSRLSRLPESYSQAEAALANRSNSSRVVLFDEAAEATLNGHGRPYADEVLRKEMRHALLSRDSELLIRAFGNISVNLGGSGARFAQWLDICCSTIFQILSLGEHGEDLLNSVFTDNDSGYRCLYSMSTVGQLSAWFNRLGEGLAEAFENRYRGYSDSVAIRIKNYIDEHFTERIDLKDLARQFNMSPNYISTLFKRVHGLGVIAYQNVLRIEKAKELLKMQRLKVYEVSGLTGFDSPYYFSKVFKKVSGLSPRDWLASSLSLEQGEEIG